MYGVSLKDEAVVRLVGKLSMKFKEIDQISARNIIEEVLYDYDITTKETSLIASDIEDKIYIYLTVKKMDGLSYGTLRNYNLNLIKFSSYFHKPLSSITSNDIRIYLLERCKNMKPSSVNNQISILKSFFAWLFNEEYISKNPMVKIKQTKEPKRLREALTEEEIEITRQACVTIREKALVEFLYSTGCRLSEVVNTDIHDLNWSDMSLRVIGKGDKQRTVYFSVKSKLLLKKYLATRKDNNEALFITTRKPYARLGSRSIQREIKKIVNRTNIEKKVSPHIFRHSFATHKLNAGMPLTYIQILMGHENPSTTQLYAKLSQENIKHEYRRIS